MPDQPDEKSRDETASEIEDQLTLAREIARAAGKSLTPVRAHFYRRLLTEGPLGAYDLLEGLDGVASAKPPTAYRTLEFLQELGLIRKLQSVSKYIATPLTEVTKPMAFVVCRECGVTEQLDCEPSQAIIFDRAKQNGFEQIDSTIEISGRCGDPHCTDAV